MDPDLDLKPLNLWLERFYHQSLSPALRRTKPKTMQLLCDFFNNPEKSAPCLHVSGSKGKGTIAASISSILTEAGYKTGLFVSPHVVHFAERITLNGKAFPEKIYNQAFEELKSGVEAFIAKKPTIEKLITWDELVTLYAMLVFRIAKVDYAVFEVGLGGRLDPTNVVTPIGVAFGPIELEHTRQLGSTLSAIAREKAGIMKTKVPAVSAPQKNDTHRVFDEVSRAKFTHVTYVPKSLGNYETIDKQVAYLLTREALPGLSRATARAGLRNVHPLPARFEKLDDLLAFPNLPFVLIDGAHTPGSIKVVLARLRNEKISGNLLFGCGAEKDISTMSRELFNSGLFSKVYLTKSTDFKLSNVESMKNAFISAGFKDISAEENQPKQIKTALKASDKTKTPLIVLGSLYLAGEVKKILE